MKSKFNTSDGFDEKINLMVNDKNKIKKAYEVLGVREGASREEIERRYYILAKNHLILQRENLKSEVVGLNMEKINEAYYLLIDLISADTGNPYEADENPQKLITYVRRNSKKAIIFFAIFIIVIMFLFVPTNNNYINIVIFGELENNLHFIKALEDNNTNINKIFSPKKVKIHEFVLSDDLALPYKLEMMLAAYNFVTEGDYHVLIMDRKSFEEYGTVANIARLDDFVEELGLDSRSCVTVQKLGIDETEHIYGLNASHLFNNRYDSAEDDDSHVIAIRDGLNSDIIKLIIEAMDLPMGKQ